MNIFRPNRIRTFPVFAAVLTLAAAGCSQNKSSQPAEPSGPVVSIDPATVGSITGTVTLQGNAPLLSPIDTPCGDENSSARTVPPVVVKGANGELANVVIYIKSGLKNYRYDTPKDPVVLDQKGCMYEPHVLAVRTNQPLEIKNEDPVAHNVHMLTKINTPWNRSEPPGAPPPITSFSKPETAIHVICKVHPWMSAFLFVFSNPYYAITPPTGTFDLKNVPPGTYMVEAWQEQFGTQDQTVTIGPKESKAIAFVFKGGNSSGD